MSQITVDIPKDALDKVAQERISALEKKLNNALTREATLKRKVLAMERNDRTVKNVLEGIRNVVDDYREELDLDGGWP